MSDHDRPLDPRGVRDARLAAEFILEQQKVPDIILSSTAARARATSEMVSAAWHGGVPRLIPELYLADVRGCLDRIRTLPDDCSTAMIVGHNPGLEELNGFLTKKPRALGTANLVILRLRGEHWRELGRMGSCTLLRSWRPR